MFVCSVKALFFSEEFSDKTLEGLFNALVVCCFGAAATSLALPSWLEEEGTLRTTFRLSKAEVPPLPPTFPGDNGTESLVARFLDGSDTMSEGGLLRVATGDLRWRL